MSILVYDAETSFFRLIPVIEGNSIGGLVNVKWWGRVMRRQRWDVQEARIGQEKAARKYQVLAEYMGATVTLALWIESRYWFRSQYNSSSWKIRARQLVPEGNIREQMYESIVTHKVPWRYSYIVWLVRRKSGVKDTNLFTPMHHPLSRYHLWPSVYSRVLVEKTYGETLNVSGYMLIKTILMIELGLCASNEE